MNNPAGEDRARAEARLALYRRAVRALEDFFRRWTAGFCRRCLEVTRRHHRDDVRADVDVVEGVFPGCCHAGVGDALWVRGQEARFSDALQEAMVRARESRGPFTPAPAGYRVRERATGLLVWGAGCIYMDHLGCRLGDLKSPICAAYACEPIREAVAVHAGWEAVGADADDFGGTSGVLAAVVTGSPEEGARGVRGLEERLRLLDRRLAAAVEPGDGLCLYWLETSGWKCDSTPARSTR